MCVILPHLKRLDYLVRLRTAVVVRGPQRALEGFCDAMLN